MLYNSKEFAIFFILVFLGFIALRKEHRKYLLILASYYFYAHFDLFLLVLLFLVSSFCYFSSKIISKIKNLRKTFFFLSLFIIFCPLIYFKYLNFVLESVNSMVLTNFSVKDIMLPVGISFFTFQAAGYLIDVFKKKITPSDSLLDFLLFISFFPQLVAGPIERAGHLLPQLKNLDLKFEYSSYSSAMKLIAWGFFKKIVIADRIASLIDPVYSNPTNFNSISLLIATILFGYQIYCDFSGYSDIAIGLAKLFGIDLMVNFRQPYLSKTIIEFWKKWHISLTTWFKDYLFIPLGGSRVGTLHFISNVLIVFLVSGIWHGANWTFVIWGLVHFFFYIAAKYIDISFLKLPNFIKVISTFFIANLAWVFFRSDSVEISFTILKRIATNLNDFSLSFDSTSLLIIVSLIVFLELMSLKSNEFGYPCVFDSKITLVRWFLYFAIIILTILLGEFNESSFIYFKF